MAKVGDFDSGPKRGADLYSIALFGPQATRWTQETLGLLQRTLQEDTRLSFVRDSVADISSLFAILEKLGTAPSNDHLRHDLDALQQFANGTSIPDARALSNTQLATLTIVSQVVELFTKHGDFEALRQFQSAQGFCTGILTAAALSISRTQKELERSIATAINLAASTGFIIDADNESKQQSQRGIAVSVRWKTTAERSLLDAYLDHPGTYVSCITDDRTLTATVLESEVDAWRTRLAEANFATFSVGLTGSYHHPSHFEAAEKLKKLVAGDERFTFPEVSSLRLPLRSTSDASLLSAQSVQADVINLILCKRAHWYAAVKAAQDDAPNSKPLCVAIGQGSPLPRSLNPATAHHAGSEQPFEEVAVVGMACRFPGADSVEDFWKLLETAGTSFGKLPEDRFDPSIIERAPQSNNFWGNFLQHPDAFDHRFFNISGREAKSMDPQQRLALQVAYEALESSGYCNQSSAAQETDIGCYLGVGSVDYNDNIESENANAFSAVGSLRAFISGRLSHYFGWSGPSITFDTACSSSAVAIHSACRAILGGECAMAIAGGVNVITSPALHQNLAAASFLNPDGRSRAFDVDANGYCRGEGAGLLVLKPLSQAIANHDQIIGVISGSAVNQGSNCSPITVPDSGSQSTLYQRALDIGMIKPLDVTYVEAHGTGTQVGDPIEYESIQRAMISPDRKDTLYLGSVKDNIGHCEAASGAAGLIKVLLMMQKGSVPKQANFTKLNPKIEKYSTGQIKIPDANQEWSSERKVALVNNYGAGGSNAAIVVRSYTQEVFNPDDVATGSNASFPVVLSAKSLKSLVAYAKALKTYLLRSNTSVASLSHNLSWMQNPRFEYRESFVATDTKSCISSLDSILSKNYTCVKRELRTPIVLAFGGQTGLSINLSKNLYDSSDIFRSYLDSCDATCKALGLSSIYPGIFSAEPVESLIDLHCRLLSVQIASAQSWLDAGLEVDTLVGHSFGQISALCVAGALTTQDAFRYVSGRAKLVRDNWGPDNGVMLSLDCNVEQAESLVRKANTEEGVRVEIACYNGPSSTVLAGDKRSIAETEKLFSGHKATRLSNSHAYHSHLTDNVLTELRSLAGSITISKPQIPVETCSPGASWSDFSAEELAQHTRQPVYFGQAVERIAARFPSAAWIEAGSASPVVTMARRVLRDKADRSDLFLPMDLSSQGVMRTMATAVSRLWQEGSATHFWMFPTSSKAIDDSLNLPPYQFEDNRHWIQYKPRGTGASSAESQDSRPAKLVTLKDRDTSTGQASFAVDIAHVAFDLATRGHAVTGQSLCPASMYIELAVTGALQLEDESSSKSSSRPHIEGLMILSPLGLGSDLSVSLRLSKDASSNGYDFTIYSQPFEAGPKGKITEHGKGVIKLVNEGDLVADSQLQLLKKLVRYGRADRIIDAPSAAGISGSMVYQIFSEVVEYAGYYQGVKSVRSLDNEAVGSVTIPSQPVLQQEYVSKPYLLDNFLQVAGIHVNCLTARSKDEVYVCTAIEEVTFTETFMKAVSESRKWTVYTRSDKSAKSAVTNDIFVFDRLSQELVLAITGAIFKNVPFKSLARSLNNVNQSKKPVVDPQSATSSDMYSDSETAASSAETDASSPPNEPQEMAKEVKSSKRATKGGKKQTPARSKATVFEKVRKMLSDVIEIPVEEIKTTSSLESLGIDSLLITEVLTEIQEKFGVDIAQEQIMECEDVAAVCRLIQPEELENNDASEPIETDDEDTAAEDPVKPVSSTKGERELSVANNLADVAVRSFNKAKPSYDMHADETDFTGFYTKAHPIQSQLVVRYVADAFAKLDVDLDKIKPGGEVAQIEFHKRHAKLIPQLYRILIDAGLVEQADNGTFLRTSKPLLQTSAGELHASMLDKFPQHVNETKLLATTAPKLAECLSGKADPISLIFKNAAARDLLTKVYTNAPMFESATLVLKDYLCSVLKDIQGEKTIRILELGGGTGGTTVPLLEAILELNLKHKIVYTFTDLSSSLVVAAKKKFAKYDFMEFITMDIDKDPKHEHTDIYDIVLSTNCIHATPSLVRSTTNIRKMLRHSGILCLVELTRNLFWFDLVFGLLDGWWLFDDGRQHALAHEQLWKKELRTAGFNWVDWSDTKTQESDCCRVITASPSDLGVSAPDEELASQETITFQNVDGQDLQADVYYPSKAPEPGKTLPVALMIHGGGHIMLSRKDVRPEQTEMLLSHGFLPISVDYRLCPEVTLYRGPMMDVANALEWARNILPKLSLDRPDIKVNGEKVVAVGWSTGGTLAMSLAWTCVPLGIRPPDAIFALYCPTDYEDPFWTQPNVPTGSKTRVNSTGLVELDDMLWSGIYESPITAYNVTSDKAAVGGWMATADPRSRIALYMNHQGRTLHTLIRGLDKTTKADPDPTTPSADEIREISPLAQIRSGAYRTPTFVLHPYQDDLIPWKQAEETVLTMKEKGVPAQLRLLEKVPHLFDVYRNWQRNESADQAVREGYEFLAQHAGMRSG